MSRIILELESSDLSAEHYEAIKTLREIAKVSLPDEFSKHTRNMIKGWSCLGTVDSWTESDGPFCPGTYALVYDNKGNITNPILWNSTLLFGESTRDGHKRIYTHTGALRGKSTNSITSWRRNIPKINSEYSCNIQKELHNVKIFFRPHSHTDKDLESNRTFSCLMEKQAHAQYMLLHGHGTICNSRDIPNDTILESSMTFLKKEGYPIEEVIYK